MLGKDGLDFQEREIDRTILSLCNLSSQRVWQGNTEILKPDSPQRKALRRLVKKLGW